MDNVGGGGGGVYTKLLKMVIRIMLKISVMESFGYFGKAIFIPFTKIVFVLG